MASPLESIWVRCSALPRFFECPSSAIDCEAAYNPGSDASRLGTAVHELARHIYDHRAGVSDREIQSVAKRYRVEARDVERFIRNAEKCWEILQSEMPKVAGEVSLNSPLCGGTADLISADQWHCVIVDWKTGRSKNDHTLQLTGYAYAYRHQYGMPKTGYIRMMVADIEARELSEPIDLNDDDLDAFARDFRQKAKEVGRTFAPGNACGFCPRQLECAARREFLNDATTVLDKIKPQELTSEQLARAYSMAMDVDRLVRRVKDAAKLYVSTVGDLDLPDGKVLTLTPQKRDNIDARAALPVLMSEFELDPDALAGAVDIKKTALEKLVKDHAPHGQKSHAVGAVFGRLREVGAMTSRTTEIMRAVKK